VFTNLAVKAVNKTWVQARVDDERPACKDMIKRMVGRQTPVLEAADELNLGVDVLEVGDGLAHVLCSACMLVINRNMCVLILPNKQVWAQREQNDWIKSQAVGIILAEENQLKNVARDMAKNHA
jgi:hypothetical protein